MIVTVTEYLRTWSDQDWEEVGNLYNDGMSIPEALVQVHRMKLTASSPGVVDAPVASELPKFQQQELILE